MSTMRLQQPTARVPGGLSYRIIKPALDAAAALCAMLVLLPLIVLIAVAIKTTSRGPVFYRWRIVGQGGKPVGSYKFRTMVVDAEAMEPQLRAAGRNEMAGVYFKLAQDPRVTSLGRLLRKYSLDELPTLLSVVKGDLSLVGPRPVRQSEASLLQDWHRQRLAVKPGITGLWQVSGKNAISDFDDVVRMDLKYIQDWSIWRDVVIVLRTIWIVVAGHNS